MNAKSSNTLTTPWDVLIGTELVVLKAADFAGINDTLPRGARFKVTPGLIEASVDRLGRSWLRIVDDPDLQERTYGGQIVARAETIEEPIHSWLPGDAEWERERGDRRREIVATTAEGSQARRDRFDALQREFGDAPLTSTILYTTKGDDGSEAVRR